MGDGVVELERAKRDIEVTIGNKEKNNAQLAAKLDDEQNLVAKAQKGIKEIQGRVEAMEEELEAERQARAKAERQRSDLAREIDSLGERLDEASGATTAQVELNKKRDAEVNKLRKDVEEANIQQESILGNLKRKQGDAIAEMSEQIDALGKMKSKIEKDKGQIMNEIADARAATDEVMRAQASSDKSNKTMLEGLNAINKKVDNANLTLGDFAASKNKIAVENSDLLRIVGDLDNNLNILAKQKAALAAQLNDVKAVGHVVALRGNLALGLLNLVQLSVQVVNGSLSLSQTSGELHPGHLKLLALGDSVGLVLLAPALGLGLSLGTEPQGVLTAGSLLLEGATGSIKLVLQVPVFAKEKTPLAGLVVAQSLDVVELGGLGSLLLGQDVEVVVEVANNAKKVRVLAGYLVLVGGKVSKSQVGIVDLLVDGVEGLQHLLVGHVGRGLRPHHLVSGGTGIGDLVHDENLVLLDLGLHFSESINLLSHLSSGISLLPLQVGEDGLLLDVGFFHVLAQLVHLGLALLVQLHLGSGGAAGLIQTLAKLIDLPGQVGPLPLGLGASLTLGLEFLLHGLDTALNLLDSLLGLGDQVLLVVKLGSKL